MDWRRNKHTVPCELWSKSFRCLTAMRTLESLRCCGLNTLSVDISVPLQQWQEVRPFSGDCKPWRLFLKKKNGLRTLISIVCSSYEHEFTRLPSVLCALACLISIWDCREMSPASGNELSLFQLVMIYPIGCFVINRRKGTKHTAWSLRAMHIDGMIFYYINLYAKEKCYVLTYFFPIDFLFEVLRFLYHTLVFVYSRFRTLNDSLICKLILKYTVITIGT